MEIRFTILFPHIGFDDDKEEREETLENFLCSRRIFFFLFSKEEKRRNRWRKGFRGDAHSTELSSEPFLFAHLLLFIKVHWFPCDVCELRLPSPCHV